MLRHVRLLLLIAAAAAWFVVLRPTALGGPASYIFVSGVSMEPTLESGDLAVLQRADEYAIGDIVAFEVPDGPGAGALVIHRIIGGSGGDGFVMQGDNKRAPDEWNPTEELVAGRMWLHLPGAGTVVSWLRQPAVFASLLAGLVVFFIVLGGGDRPKSREAAADG
jgi:signal peptidase